MIWDNEKEMVLLVGQGQKLGEMSGAVATEAMMLSDVVDFSAKIMGYVSAMPPPSSTMFQMQSLAPNASFNQSMNPTN